MELVEVQYDFHDFTRRNVEHLNYLLFNLKKKVKREKRWKGEEMRKRENKQKLIEKIREKQGQIENGREDGIVDSKMNAIKR